MNCTTINHLTYEKNKKIISALIIILSLFFESTADAYELLDRKWPQPSATFYVDIAGAEGKWNDAFEGAMYLWGVDTNFDFLIVRDTYEDPCDPTENGRNGVAFRDTNCGDAWGSTTIAICQSWFIGSTITQTDIVFNENESWNVYSTPWSSYPWYGVNDFKRVAVHELGHALGLGHEDSGPVTIMGTYAGDITTPQQDDINGVAALYGSACTYSISPSSGSFSSSGGNNAVSVTASSPNCSWTTSETLSWASLSPISGTGDNMVTILVETNTSSPRTGSITIAGETFSISQDAIPISDAADNDSLTWATSGDADWYGQSSTFFYGGSSTQSGAIENSEISNLSTTVTGPGTISFYWKVSSEQNYDYLRFYIDGVKQAEISGDIDWEQKRYNIESGTHTLIWTYEKDSIISAGSDAGWIDRIIFGSQSSITPIINLLLLGE